MSQDDTAWWQDVHWQRCSHQRRSVSVLAFVWRDQHIGGCHAAGDVHRNVDLWFLLASKNGTALTNNFFKFSVMITLSFLHPGDTDTSQDMSRELRLNWRGLLTEFGTSVRVWIQNVTLSLHLMICSHKHAQCTGLQNYFMEYNILCIISVEARY